MPIAEEPLTVNPPVVEPGDPAPAPDAALHVIAPPSPKRFSTRTKIKHALKRISHGLEELAPYVLPIFPNRGPAAEVRVGGYTVRCYKHWPNDPQLLADWDELTRQTQDSTCFQSPHWQHGATRVPDATGLLRLITVHEGSQLLAAVPLEKRWGGHWRTVGMLVTAYHDPLVHPKDPAGVLEAMMRGIAQLEGGRTRSVTFDLLSTNAPCVSLLPPAARAAGFGGGEVLSKVWDSAFDLPTTWDDYLASLKKNDRSKLRRRLKKVEESGRAKFVICDTAQTVAEALPPVLDLLEKCEGGKGRRARWLIRPHLKLAAPALARDGRLLVYQLFIDGQLANGDIALQSHGRLLMWTGVMNPSLRDWSPGIAMLAMVIRHAIEQGYGSIDFLRGILDYKREMGAVLRPMHKLVFTREPARA